MKKEKGDNREWMGCLTMPGMLTLQGSGGLVDITAGRTIETRGGQKSLQKRPRRLSQA